MSKLLSRFYKLSNFKRWALVTAYWKLEVVTQLPPFFHFELGFRAQSALADASGGLEEGAGSVAPPAAGVRGRSRQTFLKKSFNSKLLYFEQKCTNENDCMVCL